MLKEIAGETLMPNNTKTILENEEGVNLNTEELKGQALIDWWKTADPREKDALIAEKVMGWKWGTFKGVGRMSLMFPPEYFAEVCKPFMGWEPGRTATPDFDCVTFSDGRGGPKYWRVPEYTSDRSPRWLIEKGDREVTANVFGSGWIAGLERAVQGKSQGGHEYSDSEMHLNCAAADADTRCLGWLLALEKP